MTTDLHSLVAPYALDALDPHERGRFEAHLDQCIDCQEELAGFTATAVRLGDAAQHDVPPGLRDRLLATVATTPQARPVVTSITERSRLRRTIPRLVAAAALVVGIVGVGGYAYEHGQAEDARNRNVAITSVLAASDAKASTQKFETGGNVMMVTSTTEDAAVIVAHDLPKLAGGKVYQVWTIENESPRSQGTFHTSGDMVMTGVSKADRVAITIEPRGGSAQPTTPPIASMAV